MPIRVLDSPDAPSAPGTYAQAVEVTTPQRLLFISGQVGRPLSGELPDSFADQCELAWTNVRAQLLAARMDITDLVKVNVFIASRDYFEDNRRVRNAVLGGHCPALSVLVCDFLNKDWLVEIEAVAAQ